MDYEKEIEELKRRLTIVENNLNASIKIYNMDKSYNNADNNGIRQSVSNNTSGVAENGVGLLDIASLSDENSLAIEDIAVFVDDLEQRVSALEEG